MYELVPYEEDFRREVETSITKYVILVVQRVINMVSMLALIIGKVSVFCYEYVFVSTNACK